MVISAGGRGLSGRYYMLLYYLAGLLEKAEKNIMLKLISCIKERLAEINDGNFVVEDLETERLKNL